MNPSNHARFTLTVFTVVLTCALCLLILAPRCVHAEALTLKNMVMDNQAGTITARFGILLNEEGKVEEALKNGINLKLECDAALYRHQSLWPDSKVGSTHYENNIYYDSLSGEYVLEQPERKNPVRNKSLSLLLEKGWKSLALDLGPWSLLERDIRYQLILNVKLDQDEVPAWLRYTLFFWSWDVVPAATYQLDFTY